MLPVLMFTSPTVSLHSSAARHPESSRQYTTAVSRRAVAGVDQSPYFVRCKRRQNRLVQARHGDLRHDVDRHQFLAVHEA